MWDVWGKEKYIQGFVGKETTRKTQMKTLILYYNDYSKMYLKEMAQVLVNWINLAQDMGQWQDAVNTIRHEEFFDKLRNCQFKTDSSFHNQYTITQACYMF